MFMMRGSDQWESTYIGYGGEFGLAYSQTDLIGDYILIQGLTVMILPFETVNIY